MLGRADKSNGELQSYIIGANNRNTVMKMTGLTEDDLAQIRH